MARHTRGGHGAVRKTKGTRRNRRAALFVLVSSVALLVTSCSPLQPTGVWLDHGTVVVAFNPDRCFRTGEPIDVEFVDVYDGPRHGDTPGKETAGEPVWRAVRLPSGDYRTSFVITDQVDGYAVVSDLASGFDPDHRYYVYGMSHWGGNAGWAIFTPQQLKSDEVYLGNHGGRETYESMTEFDRNPLGCNESKQREAALDGAAATAMISVPVILVVVALILFRRQSRRADADLASIRAAFPWSRESSDLSAPGWYVDPDGRHELRWFDGSAWTSSVSDGGGNTDDAT